MKTTIKTMIKTTSKTTLKTHIVILVKIKKSLIKKMSFIKIKDPRKREELIKDLIETRKRIKDNFIARKVGESEYQRGLTKLFKPITETQKATAKEITEAQKATAEKITSELLPIKEGVERLPEAITFPSYPSIETIEEKIQEYGPIAAENLRNYGTPGEGVDLTSGVYFKTGEGEYIGSEPIKIDGDDIIIDDDRFKGTPGLWKLITSKNIPDISEYKAEDLYAYIYIMELTNTAHVNYDPNQKYKGGNNKKMNELIKPFVKELKKGDKELIDKIETHFKAETGEETKDKYEGEGLTILPSDPNALIDRLDLLLSSQNAGHTGVRNELVSIFDELKRQGVINTNTYKKLNSIIKK